MHSDREDARSSGSAADEDHLTEVQRQPRQPRPAAAELKDPSRDQLGGDQAIAERLDKQSSRRSSWDHALGPFYTTEQLTELLGVPRAALLARVRRHSLLSVRTRDDEVFYPSFQFQEGRVVNGFAEVLRVTAGVVNEWTLASWLVAAQTTMGMSVVDALKRNGADTEVIDITRRAVERWTH